MWRKLIWLIMSLSLLGLMGCATSASKKGTLGEEPWYLATQELREDVARLENSVEQLGNETAALEGRTTNLDNRVSLIDQELKNQRGEPALSQPLAQPATGGVQALYNDALADYSNRHFDLALQKLSRLIRQHPKSSLADNSQYWLAECHYGLEDFPRAVEEFQKVFSYADTEEDDDAQLKLGYCYANMGDTIQAIAELNKLINLYPDSEYIGVARMRIAELSP